MSPPRAGRSRSRGASLSPVLAEGSGEPRLVHAGRRCRAQTWRRPGGRGQKPQVVAGARGAELPGRGCPCRAGHGAEAAGGGAPGALSSVRGASLWSRGCCAPGPAPAPRAPAPLRGPDPPAAAACCPPVAAEGSAVVGASQEEGKQRGVAAGPAVCSRLSVCPGVPLRGRELCARSAPRREEPARVSAGQARGPVHGLLVAGTPAGPRWAWTSPHGLPKAAGWTRPLQGAFFSPASGRGGGRGAESGVRGGWGGGEWTPRSASCRPSPAESSRAGHGAWSPACPSCEPLRP